MNKDANTIGRAAKCFQPNTSSLSVMAWAWLA